MKAAVRTTAVLLILLLSTFAYAQFSGYEFDYDYYSDATFTTAVGWYYILCDGTIDQGGTTSDYRTKTRINCSTGGGFQTCQEYINGSWTQITCPF